MNITVLNTNYDSAREILNAELLNRSSGKIFSMPFCAREYDEWSSKIAENIPGNDLWVAYEEAPTLFRLHTTRFILEKLKDLMPIS